MADKEQALHQFWSGFGWKAYDENTVPDNAMEQLGGHYITYSVVTAALDEPVPIHANLWMRDTSWEEITQKANAISEAIGIGGVVIPFDSGYLWICRGTPFSQRLPESDDTIRKIYLNLMVEYLSAN
jgi:hypothetical protein